MHAATSTASPTVLASPALGGKQALPLTVSTATTAVATRKARTQTLRNVGTETTALQRRGQRSYS